jgi:drug/metabolite transporter (DMT)-like permease
VAGFAGVLLMAGPGELAGNQHVDRLGTGVLLVASLSWSLGSLYARGHAHRTERAGTGPSGALAATSMQMLTGGALLLVLGVASGEVARLSLSAISARSVLALLYLVLFGSLVGFTAYAWLLRVVAPVRVATYAYVNPVIAVALGWLVGGEELTLRTLLAAAVIVPAVAVISRTAKATS